MMYLKEHFLSIQGEGKFRGELSVFIRFAKCNRDCSNLKVEYKINNQVKYGCDSYDSVDMYFKNQWQKVDFEKLKDIAEKYDCRNIVVTGGEPLLNIKNNDFLRFIEWLKLNNFKTTIETNGDIDISDDRLPIFSNVVFSISPKEIIETKKYWFENRDSYIKAIYNYSNVDTKYLTDLKNKGMNVYIMPKGETSEMIENQRKEVFEYCLKNRFNYTDREHLHIFKEDAMQEAEITQNIQ